MGWIRTWMSVAASLLGLASGTAISDDAVADGERDRAARPRLEATGYAASGPSYYVWDEDPRQARRWAEELSRAPAPKQDRAT